VKERAPSRAELFETEGYRVVVERIAANVRRLRDDRGWTQEHAADACDGLDTTVYRAIEAGRSNVTANTLSRLCEGFAVDVAELFAPAPPLVKRPRGRPKVTKPAAE
jgi:transcriptional regulator with XRE-family HTH domain